MTSQLAALIRLARFLDRTATPYVIIGGLANIVWGEPRATLDIDALLQVGEEALAAFVGRVANEFIPLVPDPLPFIASTRVLPVESPEQVRIDLVFGLLAFEEQAIARGRTILVEGAGVRFCTPEDLTLMKIASDREKDLADAHAIVLRRFGDFDLAYLEPRIRELATLLDRPDIVHRWEQWTAEAHRRAGRS
jgi:hypothetical protein